MPVIFEDSAVEDNNSSRKTFQPNSQRQKLSGEVLSTSFENSNTAHPLRPDQTDMEFAAVPSNPFGHFGHSVSTFDMRHISNTLPNYNQHRYAPQPQHQSQYSHGATINSNFAYPTMPAQQFASQIAQQYTQQYPQHINASQRHFLGYTAHPTATFPEPQPGQQLFSQQQQPAYGSNMSQQPPYSNYYSSGAYGQLQSPGQSTSSAPAFQLPRLQVENDPQILTRHSSSSSLQTSSTLRGPPRKPKQSGHALWVGNLPPGTQILDLKDHFSRDATDEIESVFLISKSNCAFVNYKTEESCAQAMNRFHESRFRGARLVCRLRRGSNSATTPTSMSMAQGEDNQVQISTSNADEATTSSNTVEDASGAATGPAVPQRLSQEKFFIVKSLTVEDLERSVVSGIWATQAHNETNLNLAFSTAENVYLIFSANKSGEYFGYARMDSTITEGAVTVPKEDLPQVAARSALPTDLPRTIPTPATATAPKGHIIDDSSRGTIFWEAEATNLAPLSTGDASAIESGESGDDVNSSPSSQQTTFGKPFKITWQSTERLPFYRTRGLRNPWNANREVKIARDGTELEPSVGRKLLGMFEQQAQINAAARATGPPPPLQQYGYSQQIPQYSNMIPQGPYAYGHQAYGHHY